MTLESIQGHYSRSSLTNNRHSLALRSSSIDTSKALLLECYSNGLCSISDSFIFEKLSDSMEKVRSDFAMETETDGGGMVGIQSARGPSAASTNPLNFSLKNFGTELRWDHKLCEIFLHRRRLILYSVFNKGVFFVFNHC